MRFTKLENEVLCFLLAGDHFWLQLLRQQMSSCTIVNRELTGVGFYTTLQVPKSIPRLPSNSVFSLGDVYAKIEGLINPVGFLLFIRDGSLSYLEGYSHGEPWVGDRSFELYYDMKGKERDFQKLFSKLASVKTEREQC